MSVQTPRKKAAKKTAAKKTVAKVDAAKKPCTATKAIRVDPRVMTEAKLIVFGGRYTKIEIIDARTVVVR